MSSSRVCPGIVETPMYDEQDANLARLGAPEGLRLAQRARFAPIGRAAQPDEIAGAILYLLGRTLRSCPAKT